MQHRYSGIAVGLHWLIAVLIIGMLALGKWMTALDIEDPLRFSLTQWHKSFGVVILLLSVFRLYWRATHKPPPLNADSPAWERRAAALTHGILYLLMLAVPVSGWLLVSASALNIPTVLFQTLPWPHIPLPELPGPETQSLEQGLVQVHHLASNLLLLLLLLHIGAALRHHFVLRDETLSRMSFFNARGRLQPGIMPLAVLLLLSITGLVALNSLTARSPPATIAAGEVRFTASLMGSDLVGVFDGAEIELRLDPAQPETGVLNASVMTATLQTGDSQVDDTLHEKDWFDSDNYPVASFRSDAIKREADGTIVVSGTLGIKDTQGSIRFPVTIESVADKRLLKGGFTINRLDYKVGAVDQPGDGYAGFNVLIEFAFELD